MLRRLKSGMGLTVFRTLAILACSLSLSAGLCEALFPMTDFLRLALFCGAGALFFSLAAAVTDYWSLIYIPLIALFAWGAFGGGPLRGSIQAVLALLLYPNQTDAALLLYRLELTKAVAGVSVSLCAAICLTDAPFLMGVVLTGALLPAYLTASSLSVLWAAIGAGGILLMLSALRTGSGRFGAAAVTALLIALSLFIAPDRALQNATLQEAAENAYEILEAYLPARDSGYREGYSLRGDGYLPLADDFNDILGGAASPEPGPVMEVWTDETVYLRASPKNAYTGLSWQDTTTYQRYLYADIFQTSFRKALLNQEIPAGAENEPLRTVHVRMTRDAATSLFVPDRTQELTMGDASMVPYYNTASEIFLSRNLRAGDQYTVTYLPVSADRSRTRAWVLAAGALDDPRYEEILDTYLSVPDQIRQNRSVTGLAALAAGGQEELLDRALSIRDWLRTSYPYSLDVSDPPANTDFVSWFLLQERKGYCTYFASALTILCRLQGIPARFVAGYLVRPDGDGHAVVTGQMGHAWTEIYLKGFGWLTLDATPGTEETVFDDEPEPSPGEDEQNRDDALPTIPPVSEEEEETDFQTPSPAPSDAPEESETPEPGETPTGTPGPPPTAEPQPENSPDNSRAGQILLLLLAAAAALLAAYCLRLVYTDPVRAAKRRPQQASAILFRAVETALTVAGRPRLARETLDEYAHRIQPDDPSIPLVAAFAAYSAETYGEHMMQPGILVQVWKRLMKTLSPWDQMRVRFRLARHNGKKDGLPS